MSGYVVDTGEQGVEFGEAEGTALSDSMVGILPTMPTVTLGPVNGVYDGDAAGLRALSVTAQGTKQNVTVLYGIRGAPAMGDACFCAPMYQTSYKGVGTDLVTANLTFAGPDASLGMLYRKYWGHVVHTLTTEGAANAANDNVDAGAASAAGGWMMWHIYSVAGGAGTVTVSIDESATGVGAWGALAGATSGAIGFASAPCSGIVQLATNAAVKRYLRWQYAEAGGATDAVFALAFIRG